MLTSYYFLYFILGFVSSKVDRKLSAVKSKFHKRKVYMTSLRKNFGEIEVANLLKQLKHTKVIKYFCVH